VWCAQHVCVCVRVRVCVYVLCVCVCVRVCVWCSKVRKRQKVVVSTGQMQGMLQVSVVA